MSKKTVASVTICALLLIVLGCSNQPGPREILGRYLDTALKGKMTESYIYLSSSDKTVKSLLNYADSTEENPVAKLFADKTTYEVKELKITGKTAIAVVSIQLPDQSALLGDIMGAAIASAFGGKSDALEKTIVDKYKNKKLPMTNIEKTYTLIKEKDGWKIFNNWASINKIETLAIEVRQLLKARKPEEAKQKYTVLLSVDKTICDTSKNIKALGTDITNFTLIQEYIPKILVRNISVGLSILDELGVFGEIKNTGDSTLQKVEITIYCLDKAGKTIFEKSYHPVLVTDFSFSDANEPLKPNYSRKFGVKMDDAPSDWSRKVNVFVTDISFDKK
jgi:hypothetical protein